MKEDSAILVSVERENVNDDSVIVLEIFAADGDAVSRDDVILEIETSKTNLEVVSPVDGYLQLYVAIDEEVDIGAPLFSIQSESHSTQASNSAMPTSDNTGSTETDSHSEDQSSTTELSDLLFSSAAEQRRLELDVPVTAFSGSGWITVSDVEQAAGLRPHASLPTQAGKAENKTTHNPNRAEVATTHNIKRKTKRKQAESGNLTYYGNSLPQSTIWIEVAVSGSRIVRPPYLFEDNVSDLLVYEAGRLFSNYPELNAFHIDNRHYGVYESVNFGISFDSGQNLKVLSIENSDQLSLTEIQGSIESLLHLYESGDSIDSKLLTSSTVTFSDLTQSAASSMLPLLNGAQSLILGMSRRRQHTYSIAASFDHRVTEGLVVSEFLGHLAERIASYFRETGDSQELTCFSCGKTMQEELSLGNRAMLRVSKPDGTAALMCRNCFEGW